MPDSQDELGEKVYHTITELDHIDLVSVVADICHLRGWQSTIEVGNPEVAGDVLATQEFPFAHAISVVCYEDILSKDRLSEYLQTHEAGSAEDLAVVLQQPPSEGTIEFAESNNVALFDPVDITDELLLFSATDILSEYTDSFDASEGNQLSSISAGEPSSNQQPADQQEYSPSSETPKLNDDAIGTESHFLNVEMLGYTHVEVRGEEGMLVALQVSANEFDIQIQPTAFNLHSSQGLTFDAKKSSQSYIVDTLGSELLQPWVAGETEISAGGKVNYIAFFPHSENITPGKIRHKAQLRNLLTMGYDQMEDVTNKSRSFESAIEIPIPIDNIKAIRGLPDQPATLIDSILEDSTDCSPSDEVSETDLEEPDSVLSEDTIGTENRNLAIEIEGYDFYQPAEELDQDEHQDGIFISIVLTTKQYSKKFSNKQVTVVDIDGYSHQGKDGPVMCDLMQSGHISNPWRLTSFTRVDLPFSGKIKTLVYIPCNELITATEIKVDLGSDELILGLTEKEWDQLQGLPEHPNKGLQQFGYDS